MLCLQEVKASPEHVPASLTALDGYWRYWHGHKGYSGVALLLSKRAFPDAPVFSHPEFDHECRIVAAQVEDVLFASIYVPNGGKDFPAKLRFLEAMDAFVERLHREGTSVVLCGDLNVARLEIDVHPKLRNPEQIGQTPGERALFEKLLSRGLVDLHRRFVPDDDRALHLVGAVAADARAQHRVETRLLPRLERARREGHPLRVLPRVRHQRPRPGRGDPRASRVHPEIVSGNSRCQRTGPDLEPPPPQGGQLTLDLKG